MISDRREPAAQADARTTKVRVTHSCPIVRLAAVDVSPSRLNPCDDVIADFRIGHAFWRIACCLRALDGIDLLLPITSCACARAPLNAVMLVGMLWRTNERCRCPFWRLVWRAPAQTRPSGHTRASTASLWCVAAC